MDNEDEFTQQETDRQDYVDNVIQHTLDRLAGTAIDWNIEYIGEIRDAIQSIIVDELKLMTEQEFYPYREIEDDNQIIMENLLGDENG